MKCSLASKIFFCSGPFLRLMLLFSLSYGMLYFSYKYYVPWSGGADFIEYYRMYFSPLDFSAADPPHVFRQLSAIATHLVYKSGIYYPNAIWFRDSGIDQHVFFAALLTNYIFLVLCAWITGSIVQHQLGTRAFVPAALGGLICFFSFQTQVSVVTGLTDGLSWFLTAMAFLMYLRRRLVPLVVILTLAVVQREQILMLFASITSFTLLAGQNERRFDGLVLAWSLVCFAVHVLMWKMIGSSVLDITGGPTQLLANLLNFHPNSEFIFQVIISQNLLWIYIASALLLAWRTGEWSGWLPMLTGYFLLISVVTIAAVGTEESHNIGRYGGLLSPILAAGIAVSVIRLDPRPAEAGST
jgi:hypothetical protein